MGTTFKVNKKHNFFFDYEVDGKKYRETISIDMTDRKMPQRLFEAQKIATERVNQIKIDDVQLKSDGIPAVIENVDDIENFTPEQVEDVQTVAGAVIKMYDEAEKIIIAEIGRALNTDVSPAFKHISAFDIIDGEYYATMFLEALGEEMMKYAKEHPVQDVDYSKKPYMKKYLTK